MGWALHVLTLVTTMQGHLTDALPLFDRALAVTESDPALTDLRLLLQINQAVTLGCLDQYEQAFRRGRSRPGTSRTGLARHADWLRRTAPWASCCSKRGGGTRRWPSWRSCPRT